MNTERLKLVPDAPLLTGLKYTSAAVTDIRERFRYVNPKWNQRPAHLEPRKTARNRINGWD